MNDHDQNLNVGIILSRSELIEKICSMAIHKFNRVYTELVYGLNEAVPVGLEMEKKGIDVLISRRGTAEILRENLNVPVLALMSNPLDILISVKKAMGYGKKILITNFRKKLDGMEILEEIFNVQIIQGIYQDSASLERVIASAKEKKIDVIIGGGVSAKYAKERRIKAVEFFFSNEAIAYTVEDALSIARQNRREQEKSKRYQCIIDSNENPIISTDNLGVMTAMNKAARILFDMEVDHLNDHALKNYLSNLNSMKVYERRQPILNKIEKIGGNQYLTSHIPIVVSDDIVGAVSILKNTITVIKDESEVRKNLARGLVAKFTIQDLIHQSPIMVEVIKKVRRYAFSDSTLLITGETGTGKEILAQSIHNMSKRSKGPFVSINCAALPDQLLENELFGHEEGSFTGSRRGGKIGLFELAHRGTIFLDEIGSTPPNVQTRLLRVLQDKMVMRIGSDRLIPIDIRVLAASNKDLIDEVRSGRLREDLFYRLNVLTIKSPPLRERIDDIPTIIEHLIKRISDKNSLELIAIPDAAICKLMSYSWPGNVRQLENFIERLLLLSDAGFNETVFDELFGELQADDLLNFCSCQREPEKVPLTGSVQGQVEMISEVLADAKFCKTRAAKMLGVSRTTLWRKMKAFKLN